MTPPPTPPHLQDRVDPTSLRHDHLLERRVWLIANLHRIESQLGEPRRLDRAGKPLVTGVYRRWRGAALRALASVSRELQLVKNELRARHQRAPMPDYRTLALSLCRVLQAVKADGVELSEIERAALQEAEQALLGTQEGAQPA